MHRTEDGTVLRRIWQVTNEIAVDLDRNKGQFFESREILKSGTEVVYDQPYTDCGELLKYLPHGRISFHRHRFGDLKEQTATC